MTKAKEGEFVPGYALHEFPFFIWYTYPQLLLKNAAPRPGSFFDRHGGSILGRRQQPSTARRGWASSRSLEGKRSAQRHQARRRQRWKPKGRDAIGGLMRSTTAWPGIAGDARRTSMPKLMKTYNRF